MPVGRQETRIRARALQLLYAWDQLERPAIRGVASRLLRMSGGRGRALHDAEELAVKVAENADRLDAEISSRAENWRWERVGLVEKNILRIGLWELEHEDAPPAVVIDEAVRLAHWFGGSKSPSFVNGVLDALARQHGRL